MRCGILFFITKGLLKDLIRFSTVQFSRNSLQPHGLQHSRLPCPSPTPGVCSNSCRLSRWCHPTISSSVVPFSYCLHFPSLRVFSNETAFWIMWPKRWTFSFSINPSKYHSGLISFRMDWMDFLAVQGTPRVISNTTVQKPQFLGPQLSL